MGQNRSDLAAQLQGRLVVEIERLTGDARDPEMVDPVLAPPPPMADRIGLCE
jgi:hypothetical protein